MPEVGMGAPRDVCRWGRGHMQKSPNFLTRGWESGLPSGRCRPGHYMGSSNPAFSFPLTRERLRVPSSVLEHQQRGHCCHHHSCARCTQHCQIGADGGVR